MGRATRPEGLSGESIGKYLIAGYKRFPTPLFFSTGGRQHNNGNLAPREILLISEILISRDQNGKTTLFGLVQQFTVLQIVPTKLKGRRNLMSWQMRAKWDWSTLVEKNTHLRRF